MTCEKCGHVAEKKAVEVDGRKARACDGCGEPIPVMPGMGGAGYQAHTVDHYHPGSPAEPVHLELCRECYLADHKKAYPHLPPPKV